MCRVLNVSRSSYYKYLTKSLSPRAVENKSFEDKILTIYIESKKRYGAPKIYNVLINNGDKISLKRVQRLMCKLGIRSIVMKKFRPRSSNSKVEEKENILNRDFSTNTLKEKWVTDITYVHTKRNGWCYLASVIDYCRKASPSIRGDPIVTSVDGNVWVTKPSRQCGNPSSLKLG
jgi:transposase InsO family protein